MINNPKIGIVGCGAIGLYYGGRMTNAGHDVHFLLRSDFEHVKKHGIVARSSDGDFVLPKVNGYRSSAEMGVCDVVIVALKSTSNDQLEPLLSPLVGEGTLVLTLQNGLGNEEALAAIFGAERVAGGLCFVCINRVAPGEVEHYGEGIIALGEFRRPVSERLRLMASIMKSSSIPCRVTDNLSYERWRKLVWNVPFNGLSIVAGGVDVGRIVADAGLEKLTRQLMEEVIGAAGALGHSLPEGLVENQMTLTLTMKDYKPSSLIDYLAGREVEVEAIWGNALRAAQAAGVAMPRLEMLYFLLRNLCSESKVQI
jgi:2-dehydropantoate 2-reductase